MTKYTKTIGALAATTMLMGGYAAAELEGEINVGYTNMYEFRFVDLGQDLVSAGADVAYGFGDGWSVSAGAWYGSTNDNPFSAGSFNELDLYAGISKEFGQWHFEVGYIFYHFLNASGFDTQEIYGKVGYDIGAGFGANVTAYYDIDRYNGLYLNTELTYSWEISECLSLDLAAGVAYADGHGLQLSRDSVVIGGNPGGTLDSYQGYYVSAALPWGATENLTITPFIKYTDGASDLLTNVTDISSGQDYFIAGCSLAVSF